MKRIFWFVAASLGILAGGASPADAQSFVWFNGLGVSGGGGGMRLRPSNDSGPVSLIPIHPEGVAAGSFGAFLSLGTRRWAVMLPEFHYVGYSQDVSQLGVAVRLGSSTVEFVAESQSIDAYAVMFGAQAALVPSGRVWVRGGIGEGWISTRIDAADAGIAIDYSSSGGWALSGSAGASMWNRSSAPDRFMSVDVEFHYLRITSGGARVTAPSIRVGWRLQPFFMPR